MDDELRKAERDAASGSPSAALKLAQLRVRRGIYDGGAQQFWGDVRAIDAYCDRTIFIAHIPYRGTPQSVTTEYQIRVIVRTSPPASNTRGFYAGSLIVEYMTNISPATRVWRQVGQVRFYYPTERAINAGELRQFWLVFFDCGRSITPGELLIMNAIWVEFVDHLRGLNIMIPKHEIGIDSQLPHIPALPPKTESRWNGLVTNG